MAVLRAAGRFVLLAFDAPPAVRFERVGRRGRDESAADLEAFLRKEAEERGSDPEAQQLDACIALADIRIANDGSHRGPAPTPGGGPMTPQRISKEEYYLGIAREVARRSTCFRRSIGSLIVRDDQIISTGYVGAPRKTRDSLEHGFCLRDKLDIPHGQRYELCRSRARRTERHHQRRPGRGQPPGRRHVYLRQRSRRRDSRSTPSPATSARR